MGTSEDFRSVRNDQNFITEVGSQGNPATAGRAVFWGRERAVRRQGKCGMIPTEQLPGGRKKGPAPSPVRATQRRAGGGVASAEGKGGETADEAHRDGADREVLAGRSRTWRVWSWVPCPPQAGSPSGCPEPGTPPRLDHSPPAACSRP